jgi:hypothetical protein
MAAIRVSFQELRKVPEKKRKAALKAASNISPSAGITVMRGHNGLVSKKKSKTIEDEFAEFLIGITPFKI